MLDCINRRRDERIQVENSLLQYKIQALQVKVLASRAQLLSQFAQDVRFTRAKYMELVGQQYYQIQRDRRLADTRLPGEYSPVSILLLGRWNLMIHRPHYQISHAPIPANYAANSVQP